MIYEYNKENIDKLENVSGIYFLYNPEKMVLYVGKSYMVKRRIRQHFLGQTKLASYNPNIAFFTIKYADRNKLDYEERTAIEEFTPPFNKLRAEPYAKEDASECLRETIYFKGKDERLLRYVMDQSASVPEYIMNLIREDLICNDRLYQSSHLNEEISEIMAIYLDNVLEDRIFEIMDIYFQLKEKGAEVRKEYMQMRDWTNTSKRDLEKYLESK